MSEAPALLPDPLVDDGWLAVLDERSGRSRAVGEPVGHPRMGRGRGWRRPSGSCAGCPLGCPGPCTECVASLGPEPLLRAPAGLDRVGALVSYVGAGGRLVRSIKFANGRAPIEALGRAMAALAERSGSPPPDVVTWVPTTVARRGAGVSTRPNSWPGLLPVSWESAAAGSSCGRPVRPSRRSTPDGGGRAHGSGRVHRLHGCCWSTTWSPPEPPLVPPPGCCGARVPCR